MRFKIILLQRGELWASRIDIMSIARSARSYVIESENRIEESIGENFFVICAGGISLGAQVNVHRRDVVVFYNVKHQTRVAKSGYRRRPTSAINVVTMI